MQGVSEDIFQEAFGQKVIVLDAYASPRLSAACQECNHPMRWHDNADGHWCIACVGRASETRFKLAEKENLELLRQLGVQIKAWEAQSDLREEAETKLAAAEKELERLREVLRGNQTVWGKDLAELIDFAAERREAQAKRENSIECVAPKLREAASNIRAALGEAQKG